MTEMTANGLPIPATDEAPAPPVAAEGEPGEQPRRGRKKAVVALLLLGLLAMLTTIAIWYLLFRQPIVVPLPVIPEAQVPAYATAVYGVQRPSGVAVSPSGDRIYATQSEGERIGVVFDGGGNPIGAMVPPASTGPDHAPVYLAVDPRHQRGLRLGPPRRHDLRLRPRRDLPARAHAGGATPGLAAAGARLRQGRQPLRHRSRRVRIRRSLSSTGPRRSSGRSARTRSSTSRTASPSTEPATSS